MSSFGQRPPAITVSGAVKTSVVSVRGRPYRCLLDEPWTTDLGSWVQENVLSKAATSLRFHVVCVRKFTDCWQWILPINDAGCWFFVSATSLLVVAMGNDTGCCFLGAMFAVIVIANHVEYCFLRHTLEAVVNDFGMFSFTVGIGHAA